MIRLSLKLPSAVVVTSEDILKLHWSPDNQWQLLWFSPGASLQMLCSQRHEPFSVHVIASTN